jgi:hypothetical protein
MDGGTNEIITVTNAIIQFAVTYPRNDNLGRQVYELVSEGDGWLLTNGVRVPLKWKKMSDLSPTVWTFEDGTPLTLNKGKTWICVVPSTSRPVFTE